MAVGLGEGLALLLVLRHPEMARRRRRRRRPMNPSAKEVRTWESL